MNSDTVITLIGVLGIGSIIYFVTRSIFAGRGDLRFFEKHPLLNYRKSVPALALLSENDFEFYAIHPIAEWSQTELSYIDQKGAEAARYTLSNASLTAQLHAFNRDFEIFYPKYEIGHHLKDSSGNILATATLASIGSSESSITLFDGTTINVRPHKSYKSLLYKSDTMEWFHSSEVPFAISFHVNGKRRSNVFVLAIRKDSTELQRLCVFAFFSS